MAYFVPPATFLEIESLSIRYLLAVTLVFSPIFFANLIFSREFKESEESTRAFGWNLLGAVAGGGLEYFSLLIGYRNLLWIVALCYVLVALFTYRHHLRGVGWRGLFVLWKRKNHSIWGWIKSRSNGHRQAFTTLIHIVCRAYCWCEIIYSDKILGRSEIWLCIGSYAGPG